MDVFYILCLMDREYYFCLTAAGNASMIDTRLTVNIQYMTSYMCGGALMPAINFYDSMENDRLKFAVIISRYEDKWVFCKHKERDTWECPGGHREPGEDALDTARRELYEETGAVEYDITPLTVYGVEHPDTGEETYGLLCFARIRSFGELPDMEMEKTALFSEMPSKWTYPQIQPVLLEKVLELMGGQLP